MTDTDPSRIRDTVGRALVLAAVAAVLLVQTRAFRLASCETFDEFTFLRLGIDVFRRGDFHGFASPMDPALPVLLEYPLAALSARALPDTPGWGDEVPRLTRLARLTTSVVVGVPLVWVVTVWVSRRNGWELGLVGGLLTALSPTVVAAAAVATTDACFVLFALLALAALRRHQDGPSRGSFVTLGVALGLAFGAKQSAAALVPVAALELLRQSWAAEGARPAHERITRALFTATGQLAALGVIAFVVEWGLYGFACGPAFGSGHTNSTLPEFFTTLAQFTPDPEAATQFFRSFGPPMPYEVFFGLRNKAISGHSSYLMGQVSRHGFYAFFPVAIAVKSTPVELILFTLAVGASLLPWGRRDPTRRLWLAAAAVTLGMAVVSGMNYGHRHVLILYPLAVMLAADALRSWRRPRAALAACLVAVVAQAVSAAGVAPHYLSYFNAFCGGPDGGYRYLVDSSLDWGQDLPSLRDALAERGTNNVVLLYFGTASPEAYGLRTVDWLSDDAIDAADCRWLAVSATTMVGVYGRGDLLLRTFGPLPSVRVAHNFFLYDLGDPRVRAALRAARGF